MLTKSQKIPIGIGYKRYKYEYFERGGVPGTLNRFFSL